MSPIMSAVPVARQPRIPRRPTHTAFVRHVPWVIQPFLIAPVLPGETLKRLSLQARAVTAPIQNSIVGWWLEHYIFYVKHRDLADRDTLVTMMLDANADLSAMDDAAKLNTYHKGTTTPDFVQMCLARVVETYFRNAGEAWNVSGGTTQLNGNSEDMPLATVNRPGWTDSMLLKSAADDPTLVNEAGSGSLTAQELDTTMRAFLLLRQQNLTDMTYEDFLRTYGVSVPRAEELHVPELIRYSREWTYPTNTIDPTTGVPSSACSWGVRFQADKDRFFKEPGFIFGVTVARPKVYFRNQDGAAVQMMANPMAWLPAVMRDDPQTSIIEVAEADGPLDAQVTGDYLVDIRDLYLHGDQFIGGNLSSSMSDLTAGSALIGRIPTVDLPTSTLGCDFPTDSDIQAVFPLSDDDPLTYATDIFVRQDMVIDLEIMGTQIDQTPSGHVVGI